MTPDVVPSCARAESFHLLFRVFAQELHVQELERRSGLALGTVQQELKKREGVELLVVRKDGDLGLRVVSEWESGDSEKRCREVNPYVTERSEFRRRMEGADRFPLRVLESPRLFVVGTGMSCSPGGHRIPAFSGHPELSVTMAV